MTATAGSTIQPTADDAELARASGQRLAPIARLGRNVKVQVRDEEFNETIELPASAVKLLVEILEDMASGRAVTIVPKDAELTTQQAADCLHVSRPFLIRILEDGKIPFRLVGTHRRIRFDDVLQYKQAIDSDRRAVLDELAAEAQEMGMGY